MLNDTLARLEAAKLRWMGGGFAEASGDGFATQADTTETQLRLLAQAAVFRQTCLRPVPPASLEIMADMPVPALPEPLRPAFRQMMQANDRSVWRGVIGMMAARGVMAHPFDWMPPKESDGYPDAYIALVKWSAGIIGGAEDARLSAENWEAMYPSERRIAFDRLRAHNPNDARALMEAEGGALPAAECLALLNCFTTGLGVEDIDYLTLLSTSDRSAKIKSAASGFLARLGVMAGGQDDAKELADFMEISTTGLIRRRKVIALRAKLNPACLTSALMGPNRAIF